MYYIDKTQKRNTENRSRTDAREKMPSHKSKIR